MAHVASQLGSGFDVRTALHKNSELNASYQKLIEGFFSKAQQPPHNKEFLVDYFISLPGKKHAPILTAESEADEHCDFDDLSKLLLVHSPRRLYVANIKNRDLPAAAQRISGMLNEALASGVLSPSDQIVFLLYQQDGAGFKMHLYDFDQYRHC